MFCSLSCSSARIRSVTSQKMAWMPIGSPSGPISGVFIVWTYRVSALGVTCLSTTSTTWPLSRTRRSSARYFSASSRGKKSSSVLPLIASERGSQLGADAAVGEGETALQVLAEDHLRQGLDQGVIEDLGLPEGALGPAALGGLGLELRHSPTSQRLPAQGPDSPADRGDEHADRDGPGRGTRERARGDRRGCERRRHDHGRVVAGIGNRGGDGFEVQGWPRLSGKFAGLQ